MKIDAPISNLAAQAGPAAARQEALGYDGVRVAELQHEPFLPLALAAEHTKRVELVSGVAVAFARSPMVLAQIAHDLNAFSGGRLVLGIGSQVKPHVERRFDMPWGKPAPQMRDYLTAMRAIFACWYEGARLEHDGDYYTFNLMPDTFRPRNTECGPPRINLSATGPLMTQVAAELADGMIMHPFSTERYIREVTLPAIEKGRARRSSPSEHFELDYAPMIATGRTEEELAQSIEHIRGRIAFYGCTVAYRPVLELHGWGELQDELIPLNRAHRTKEMAGLISDEVLRTIAIVGEPREVVEEMRRRLGDTIGRTGFSVPGMDDGETAELLEALKRA